MNKVSEIKERFYFSYVKGESDYLKELGYDYLTKGIHPKSGATFTMFDKTYDLMQAVFRYREIN